MLLQFIPRYMLKLAFALSLLVGLQLPNFLVQYEHRLDAHYLEAQRQLLQYQNLANQYFSGDLHALIAKHENSDVLLFHKEALLIEKLADRVDLLEAKKKALQGGLLARLYFLASQINSPLFLETKENYNAEVVLNKDSIIIGLVSALSSTLLLEFLFMVFACQWRRLRAYFHSGSQKMLGKDGGQD